VLEVKKAISDSREALLQVSKETSTAILWFMGWLAIALIFSIAYGIYVFAL
jgi:hypothetical protein